MAADPRIEVYVAWERAMQDKVAATFALHDAEVAIATAAATIAEQLSDLECWVYGEVALVRDPMTHKVITKRVVRLGG